MSERQHTTGLGESPDSPDLVLAALHSRHQVATQVEIDKLQLAVAWAVMHPVESIDHGAATVDGTEGELAIAGPGAPLVAEFCVADLALALGMSTDAGRTYLGDAIELRYRLPKLWAVVTTGRVPVWKARRIAQATKPLCLDAAAYVDRHLAHQARRLLVRADRPRHRRRAAAVRPGRGREAPPRRQPMPGTSTSTSSRCPSTAPSTSTPTSTWLMRSTSTTPSPPAPPSWAASGARSPSTSAAPSPPGRSPAAS